MRDARHPAIVGVDSALYTVESLQAAVKTFERWGLQLLSQSDQEARLATQQGTGVVLTSGGETSCGGLGALTGRPGFRGILWGVKSRSDLELAHARLRESGSVSRAADGTVWGVDPFGYDIGFRVWTLQPLQPGSMLVNTPGNRIRISKQDAREARPRPIRIGHVVFEIAGPADLRRIRSFYEEGLGFHLSDGYVDTGAFLRCAVEQDHHNIALLNVGAGINRFQHLAFEMQDIHSVFSGGLHFSEQGYATAIGPGRHKFSSAYFWYFDNPLGGQLEYFADMDYLDSTWQPRMHAPDPSSIAEWAFPDGAKRFKSMRQLKESK